jgi:hypothetical protein
MLYLLNPCCIPRYWKTEFHSNSSNNSTSASNRRKQMSQEEQQFVTTACCLSEFGCHGWCGSCSSFKPVSSEGFEELCMIPMRSIKSCWLPNAHHQWQMSFHTWSQTVPKSKGAKKKTLSMGWWWWCWRRN